MGELYGKVTPDPHQSRIVNYDETWECAVCRGEDHKVSQCRWGDGKKFDTFFGRTRPVYPYANQGQPSNPVPEEEDKEDEVEEGEEKKSDDGMEVEVAA